MLAFKGLIKRFYSSQLIIQHLGLAILLSNSELCTNWIKHIICIRWQVDACTRWIHLEGMNQNITGMLLTFIKIIFISTFIQIEQSQAFRKRRVLNAKNTLFMNINWNTNKPWIYTPWMERKTIEKSGEVVERSHVHFFQW